LIRIDNRSDKLALRGRNTWFCKVDSLINEVIRGESAEDIANTVIKRGLLSRLDHAAYLGREPAKAEMVLNQGG